MRRWARYWTLLARVAIGVGAVVLVFRYAAEFQSTVGLLRGTTWLPYAAGLAIAAMGELVTTYKWQLLLKSIGARVPLLKLYRFAIIGMFYNNLLPGSVGGDVGRVVLTRKLVGGSAPAAAAIFMQRNTGVGGLLIVASIAAWLPPLVIDFLHNRQSVIEYIGIWFALLMALYGLTNLALLHPRIYDLLWRPRISLQKGRLAAAWERVSRAARRFHDGMILTGNRLLWPFALSIVSQLVDSTIVYLASVALGLHLPFQYFLVFVPVTTLAALLPVTVNGIGLREATYLLLLRSQGVNAEAAVAISFLHFSYILLLSVLGGILQLIGERSRISDADSQAR